MNLKQLYQDIILEHGRSPRNLGKCEGYSHEAKGYNPLCGDRVHVYLKLDNGKTEIFWGKFSVLSIDFYHNKFICINHVYAEYYDNRNSKDWFCDRLNNRCIQNACDFHN